MCSILYIYIYIYICMYIYLATTNRRCLWCLTQRKDVVKFFHGMSLLSTLCCDMSLCMLCGEAGARMWALSKKETKIGVTLIHCRVPRGKTSNVYPRPFSTPEHYNREHWGESQRTKRSLVGFEPTSAHTYESKIQRSTTYATPTPIIWTMLS